MNRTHLRANRRQTDWTYLSHCLICLVGAMVCVGFMGCASQKPVDQRSFTFAPTQYPQAFDISQQVLMDMGFSLDRIDAASGVLSTKLHFSEGLLEPWDITQSRFRDEWEDAINHQARGVRIVFEPDQSDRQQRMGRVQVTLYRQQRADRQLNSIAVGSSSYAFDPLKAQRHGTQYQVPIRRDRALEARIATTIASHLAPSSVSN